MPNRNGQFTPMIKIDQIKHNNKNNAMNSNVPISYTNAARPIMFSNQRAEIQQVDMNQVIDAKNFLDNGSISTGMNIGTIGTPSVTGTGVRNDNESPDPDQNHVLTPMNRRASQIRMRHQSSKEIPGSKVSITKQDSTMIRKDEADEAKAVLSSGDGINSSN